MRECGNHNYKAQVCMFFNSAFEESSTSESSSHPHLTASRSKPHLSTLQRVSNFLVACLLSVVCLSAVCCQQLPMSFGET